DDAEPPANMKKLAIAEDREEDKYETATVVKCWACDAEKGLELADALNDIKSVVDGVMKSLSSARQSEVKAWEEEILPCEHTLTLRQEANGHIPASGLAHCNACDLKENLWLCMTCGFLGCGRQQFGGLGGNGHGLAHYEATRHGISVKLGTITPEGNAVRPGGLGPSRHFRYQRPNTEKSMTELVRVFLVTSVSLTKPYHLQQIEQNLKYDFSLTNEDGTALEPLFGPGLTGLSNLGNSCYMASVLQTLFALPAFQSRYADAQTHATTCPEPLPSACIECQMHKIADGLLTGRYARPAHYAASPQLDAPQNQNPGFQAGVRPIGFKTLIGKGHEEFATMRQQDAEEFFTHLVTVLRRDAHKRKDDDEQVGMYCNDCHKVRYRVDAADVVGVAVTREEGEGEGGKKRYGEVQLTQCLETLLGVEALEQTRFASFPEVLVIHAKKFQLVNWVASKLDIPVILPPSDILEFGDAHLGHGLQPTETELPDDTPAATAPEFNAAALAQLEGMGFPLVRSQKALLATGNSDAEAAMEWLFAHMDDPDIDTPIVLSQSASASATSEPPPEQIAMLADMRFAPAQAHKALRETNGDAERAVEWLFNHPDDTGEDASAPAAAPAQVEVPGSKVVPAQYRLKAFVSHKGPSVHSGHYVAHIRMGRGGGEGEGWILFNDEKVVKADEESVRELPVKNLAYLYFFERLEGCRRMLKREVTGG
ncbi:hypothetical protein H0H81_005213, partial [Sphagnurus paluster]